MAEEMMHGGACAMCKCAHHKMTPVLVVLFALLFLLGNLGMVSMKTVDIGWPILVGLAGLMKLTGGMCKCCSGSACK